MAEPPLRSQRELIGIVGGLGPWAHLELERRLLEAARRLLGARCEQELPSWLLSSIPSTPDRTAAIADPAAADPLPVLLESIRRLEGGHTTEGVPVRGADFAIIACNTAHHYLPQLRRLTRLPLLDMIDDTARALAAAGAGRRVGVLATTGTLRSGLYQRALAERGLVALTVFDTRLGAVLQERVMAAIYGSPLPESPFAEGGIKLRGVFPEARQALAEAGEALVAELGAEVLVAGCTEISLALARSSAVGTPAAATMGVPLVDPMAVVADSAVRRAYGLDCA